MKVPYNEEIANHIGPESCGCCGNTVAEALTGESIGGQLSSENTTNWVPILLAEGEGEISHSVMASYGKTWRSLRTWHVWIPHERESGEPGGTLHSKAGIGESSLQKSPGALGSAHTRCKLRTRKQSANGGWVEEGAMPSIQLIMPPAVGHNIVPEKQANKGNTVAPAEPVEGRT
jgi:hypothetical protein